MLKPLIAAFAITLSACALPKAPPGPIQIQPAAAGWNAQALEELASYLATQKSTGLVIIDNNRLIREQYWPIADTDATFKANFVHETRATGQTLEDVASQQKSFVALLVGVAIDKRLLDISKPVSAYAGPGWSKATPQQEAIITVRNLLEMNSGLKEDLTVDAPPDTKFFYNTPAYAILKRVLEGASKQPLDTLTLDWLAKPAGMNDTGWRKRPAYFADVGNPTGLVTTTKDIATMGQLVLDGGVARNGARIISKTQLDALFVRTKTNPAYGHLWWLNGSDETVNVGLTSPRRTGQFIEAGPRDMLAAMGAQDRKLFIVPSRKLIIARTGQAATDKAFNETFWQLLVKAMPAN